MDPSIQARKRFIRKLEELIRREDAGAFDGLIDAYSLYRKEKRTNVEQDFFADLEDIFRAYQPLSSDYLSSGRYRYPDLLEDHYHKLRRDIAALTDTVDKLSDDPQPYDSFVASYLGIGEPTRLRRQSVSVRLYLPSESPKQFLSVAQALSQFLREFGFDLVSYEPPIKGSWFQKWMAATRRFFSRSEVSERLEKAEKALEVRTLQKPLSESDSLQMEGAAQLIQALKTEDEATLQIGSLLLVKQKSDSGSSRIVAKSLSPTELLTLERSQNLLTDPTKIFARLEDNCPPKDDPL